MYEQRKIWKQFNFAFSIFKLHCDKFLLPAVLSSDGSEWEGKIQTKEMEEDDDCEMRNGNYPLNSKCWKCFHIMAHERRLSFAVLLKLPYAIRNSSFRGCHYRKKAAPHDSNFANFSNCCIYYWCNKECHNDQTLKKIFTHKISLPVSVCVEEAKVTTATCNHMWHTDFNPTNKLIWQISRNWRARKKQTTTWNCPSLFFFFIIFPFFAHRSFFWVLNKKTCGRCHADTREKNAQKVASIRRVFCWFRSFAAALRQRLQEGARELWKAKRRRILIVIFPKSALWSDYEFMNVRFLSKL